MMQRSLRRRFRNQEVSFHGTCMAQLGELQNLIWMSSALRWSGEIIQSNDPEPLTGGETPLKYKLGEETPGTFFKYVWNAGRRW